MESSFAKNIISTFNCDTFSKFIFKLWGYNDNIDANTCIETKYIKKLGNLPFESKKTIYTTNDKILIEKQIFNLVIPFFVPFETLNSIDAITEKYVETILRKYHRIEDNRYCSWFFPCDGNYQMPIISFVTNYRGIEIEKYDNCIIPIFEKIVDRIGLDAQVAVGSIDTFFELEERAAMETLSKFIQQHSTGLVLSFGDKIAINNFLSTTAIPNEINGCFNISEPLVVLKSKLDILLEFEELLNKNCYESTLEAFMKKYYQIIFGPQYDRIESQIWLQCKDFDIGGKDRRIDLFLRNSSNCDWELFELKKANKKVISNKKSIPNFRKEIFDNILQVKEYRKIFNQDSIRNRFSEKGIEYFNPQFNLVISRGEDISIRQWKNLVAQNNDKDFRIRVYEEIIAEAKSRINMYNQLLM